MAKRAPIDKEDKDILSEARARFKIATDADNHNRKDALDDAKFVWDVDGYQWPEDVRKLRSGRPCLTENRTAAFVRQVVNSMRQNRPSIDVIPVDSKGDPRVAKIMEGMIRHIEQRSKADLAVDNASEWAASSGCGYFRIATEYGDDDSFDQELCIKPVENPFSVYDDPAFTMPDGSDRKWCFVTEWIQRSEFKAKYGFEPPGLDDLVGQGDDVGDWYEDKRVQVAEYWRVVTTQTTATAPDGRTRKVEAKHVEQFLLTGDKIIEKGEWAGTYIPIIPIFGELKNIEGRKYRKSLIRDAKDMARINNYLLSTEVEIVALQPRAPFIGATGQFETDEAKWSAANTDNHAFIQYDPVDGQAPPMRQPPPAFPAAIRENRMGVIEAMKAIMGIYDASLGARTNETSGVAIEQRQEQGDVATFHFPDNVVRAIRYSGCVLLDLIPKVYDTDRVVRIIGPEGEADMVAINAIGFVDPRTMQVQPPAYLGVGKYDLVVKAGPSFQTQRQEASRTLIELGKAYPPLLQRAGHIIVKNMDFPGAEDVAELLKPEGGAPPELLQQMQQMQQMIQQGQQAMGKLTADLQKSQLDGAEKDVTVKQLQAELKLRDVQQRMMDEGAPHEDEMRRLKEENAVGAVKLAVKDLEIRSVKLNQQEQAVQAQMSALVQPEQPLQEDPEIVEAERMAQEQQEAATQAKTAEREAQDDQLRGMMMQLAQTMMQRHSGTIQ